MREGSIAFTVMLGHLTYLLLYSMLPPSNGAGTSALTSSNARFYEAHVPPHFRMNVTKTEIDNILSGGFDAQDHKQKANWLCFNVWLTYQLSQSCLKSSSIEEADFVFVPADLRVHLGCDPQTSYLYNRTHDGSYFLDFMEMAPTIFPHLGRLPHVVVLQVAPHYYYRDLMRHAHANMFTFINVNPYYYQDEFSTLTGRIQEQLHQGRTVPYELSTLSLDRNYNCHSCCGAVYFQSFFWNSSSAEYSRLLKPFDDTVCHRKKTLVSGSYATRKTYHIHVKDGMQVNSSQIHQREIVNQHCVARPRNCTKKSWAPDKASVDRLRRMSLHSWYSLQPIGDNVLRGAMFDAMLAYSIPVIMNKEATWSLPYIDVIDYSKLLVYIPEASFMPSPGLSVNIVDTIRDLFSKSKACDQLKEIHKILPVFVYLLDPRHDLIRFDTMSEIMPGDDAFTFAMKGVIRNLCKSGLIPKARCAA